jgi:hypothetical protein
MAKGYELHQLREVFLDPEVEEWARDARAYLEDVRTRLPAMKASEAVSLTPAKWLAARSAKAARPAA